jgi:hypothetical protein
MANARRWIDTTGGPHVLLAEELLSAKIRPAELAC